MLIIFGSCGFRGTAEEELEEQFQHEQRHRGEDKPMKVPLSPRRAPA
jgi:hypothetical protein